MEHLLNKKVLDIEISGIRKFSNMVSGLEDMISFTIGQPDFPTPLHVKEAGISAIENDLTTYTHNAGYLELRKAASDFVKQKYKLQYNPENEIIVTVGASEAIDVSLRTILTDGSEVILPGPIYPGYEPIIRMAGGIPVHIDTRDSDFKLTAEKIEPFINSNTRCIILPYPSNPTGVSLSESELRDIAKLLKGRDIFIIADEIYSELVYEEEHYSIANLLRDQTIVINGLSKSHSMTGWRVGFLFAPENITKHILKVHQYNVSCVSSISQMAAIEALTKGMDDAVPMRIEYKKRRDYVSSRLAEMGLQFTNPDGAFYFFVKIPTDLEMSSFDFAIDLAKKYRLAVVPGDAFSVYGEGYFRLSYACSMEKLQEGLNRLELYIKNGR
ncbi:aminotransferase A [Bacillus sp. FJAT-49736]|uniref:aminotransferase A n=1 Tax=Bacillus sp. FJAT-49736 TaxID=2833582 RepID=UPI001BC91051|nr:aminotransferase A [Bacillus sp. FJAT-49736]